jgi:hypothetical protein
MEARMEAGMELTGVKNGWEEGVSAEQVPTHCPSSVASEATSSREQRVAAA